VRRNRCIVLRNLRSLAAEIYRKLGDSLVNVLSGLFCLLRGYSDANYKCISPHFPVRRVHVPGIGAETPEFRIAFKRNRLRRLQAGNTDGAALEPVPILNFNLHFPHARFGSAKVKGEGFNGFLSRDLGTNFLVRGFRKQCIRKCVNLFPELFDLMPQYVVECDLVATIKEEVTYDSHAFRLFEVVRPNAIERSRASTIWGSEIFVLCF
jgi:hypothetical protein